MEMPFSRMYCKTAYAAFRSLLLAVLDLLAPQQIFRWYGNLSNRGGYSHFWAMHDKIVKMEVINMFKHCHFYKNVHRLHSQRVKESSTLPISLCV